jgi:nitrile hydratase
VNGVHDMGGTHGHGAVAIEADEPVFHEPWEGRVYGMMRGMRAAGVFNLDQFRHARERQAQRSTSAARITRAGSRPSS